MNRFYPILLDLRRRKVLVLGAGSVAERKIGGLIKAGALVRVVAPKATAKIRAWSQGGRLEWRKVNWARGAGSTALVIAATDDPGVQKKAFLWARKKGIPCNIADTPELCTFISPSIFRRGDLLVAVSTGGASPALAREIRKQLEARGFPGYPELLGLLKGLRPLVRLEIKTPALRKRYFETLLRGNVRRWALKGKLREARGEALRLLDSFR